MIHIPSIHGTFLGELPPAFIGSVVRLYWRHKTYRLWHENIYTDHEITIMRYERVGRNRQHVRVWTQCRYCGQRVRWWGKSFCRECRERIERGEIVLCDYTRRHRMLVDTGQAYLREANLWDDVVKLYEEQRHE
jgi:hypothetical protein